MAVSIHAPAKGATKWNLGRSVGGNVSIHAPAKGATIFEAIYERVDDGFNPRTREGCDGLTLRM